MKKIFVSLFACVLFLFSCNLNMSSGDTDLIVYLPGAEGKAVYSRDDVKTYRIDLTNANGDYYSETGERGGTIVFSNILCGTYTVDIWGLDENTFVAAHTSTTITVFKGEENYLSATAILGNKVNQFFVSVPEGVWLKNPENTIREAKYHNAVRDVEYNCDNDNVIHAKIINPDVEYAYLNSFYGSFGNEINDSNNYVFEVDLKAERKTTFIITVFDSLCEEYGKTEYWEYDPITVLGSFKSFRITFPARSIRWTPLVRIGFTKDAGQIDIREPNFSVNTNTSYAQYYDSVCGLPLEKHAVTVNGNGDYGKKFTFSKSKAGGKSMAAIIPLKKLDSDMVAYILEGVQVNKDVQKFSIYARSFAAKDNRFILELRNISLKADRDYNFGICMPSCKKYENNPWEGCYLEIHADGYSGDELELKFENIDEFSSQAPLSLVSGLRNLDHYNGKRLYTKAQYNNFNFMLQPGESKIFGVSQYYQNMRIPESLNNSDYYFKDVIYSSDFSVENVYFIPAVCTQIENNCSNLTVNKTDDGQFYVKNNAEYNMPVYGFVGADNKLSLSKSSGMNYNFATFDNIETTGNYKRVKLGVFDLSDIWVSGGKCNTIQFISLSSIPILGKVSDDEDNKIKLSNSSEYGNAVYQYVVKTKSGQVVKEDVVSNMDTPIKQQNNEYSFVDGYYRVFLDYIYNTNYISLGNIYSNTDLLLEVYLRWDKDYAQNKNINMLTVHDFDISLNLYNQ